MNHVVGQDDDPDAAQLMEQLGAVRYGNKAASNVGRRYLRLYPSKRKDGGTQWSPILTDLGVLHSMSTQPVVEGDMRCCPLATCLQPLRLGCCVRGSSGSATLHYNLGTAWYRQGLGRAIAHWRMGRVLSPRDTNLVHNLAVARSELTETMEPLDTQPALSQIATPNEWGSRGVSAPYLRLGAMGA